MRAGKSIVGVVLCLAGLSVALGSLGGCGQGADRTSASAAASTKAAVSVPEDAVHMILTVRGLDNDPGERRVEAALQGLGGVYRATANHETRVVEVWYDPGRVDAMAMRAAITAAGYSLGE